MIKNDRSAVVLVADDSRVVRSLLRRQLEEQGHEVIEAVDGYDALERCEASLPDVVLLDIEMPNLDGYAVGRVIKNLGDGAPALIFITGRTSEEDRNNGLELGAADFVTKPFDGRRLVERAQAVLAEAA